MFGFEIVAIMRPCGQNLVGRPVSNRIVQVSAAQKKVSLHGGGRLVHDDHPVVLPAQFLGGGGRVLLLPPPHHDSDVAVVRGDLSLAHEALLEGGALEDPGDEDGEEDHGGAHRVDDVGLLGPVRVLVADLQDDLVAVAVHGPGAVRGQCNVVVFYVINAEIYSVVDLF